jgi:hypothetical protein
MSHRVFFRHLRNHATEYVSPPSYDIVSAYVAGYDKGTGGTALAGFYEWLAVRFSREATSWQHLIPELAFGGLQPPRPFSPEEDERALGALFDWLDEFLHETGEPGRRDVFRRFETWEGERRQRG